MTVLNVIIAVLVLAALFAISACSINRFYYIDISGIVSVPIDVDITVSKTYGPMEKMAIINTLRQLEQPIKYIEGLREREKAQVISLSDAEIEWMHTVTCWSYRKLDAFSGLHWEELSPARRMDFKAMARLADDMHQHHNALKEGRAKDATDYVDALLKLADRSRRAVR